MSRPNNPQAQFARPLPGQVPADQDPQAWNGAAPAHAPQQGYHPPLYPPQAEVPPAGAYAQAEAPRYPQRGSAPPDPFAGTPYAASAHQQQRPQAYAPVQNDPYGQAQAQHVQGYGGQAYGVHPEPDVGQQARAYNQWPPAPAHDPGAYDLSSYGMGGPAAAPGYDMGGHAQRGAWAGQDPYGTEPSFEPATYAGQHHHGGTVEQTYAEEDAYEIEAPRGRGRKFAMVLLGAVIAGGGLTYAYSVLLGPSSDGAPPVVKGADGPFKVKPSEPGGKQFAHTDSKIMGRLGDQGSSSETEASGARKVSVLTVERDGSIRPPATPDEPETPRATVAVPGLTVIGGLGGPPPPRPDAAAHSPAREAKPEAAVATPPASAPQQPVVVSPPAAPQKPVVAAATVTTGSTPTASPAASLSDDAFDDTPKKAPAAKKTAALAAPAAPAAQSAPTGAGWVTVLASVPASSKSRMDALKQFADMQQKYGALLQNKTPDIQEANLGEKGTYHRLMVGPPGSRESASELCTQLKAQGYPSCWVTAY